MTILNQCGSYLNFYPNSNQLSTSSKIVASSPPYSSIVLNSSKSTLPPASSTATNQPQHREKFKQIVPRRKFTPEEDKKIKLLVEKLGTDSWDVIAEYMPDRSARQCRDRYRNYLLDYLCQEPWTCEEDQLIMSKFSKIGAHWVQIAKILGRRSGNDVKNRWYKHLSKKYNQNMQDQLQSIEIQEKEDVNDEHIKFQDQKLLNKKFSSPQTQILKNDQMVIKNKVDTSSHIKCNIKTSKNEKNPKISQNHSLTTTANKDVKTKTQSELNQSLNCYSNQNTNLPLNSYQDSIVENKNISFEAQWRNIECMNIFSNFDHEIAFDQTDFTSYIDNFFH